MWLYYYLTSLFWSALLHNVHQHTFVYAELSEVCGLDFDRSIATPWLFFFFFLVILLCSGSLSYCIIQSVPSRATGLTFDSRILWHARFQGSLNGRCCCCKTSPIISPPSLCLTACMCWMWHFALWPHISTLVETSVAKQSVFVQSFFKCIVMNVHRNMLTEPCTCSSGVFQFLWELHGMIFESEFSGAATPWKIVGLC